MESLDEEVRRGMGLVVYSCGRVEGRSEMRSLVVDYVYVAAGNQMFNTLTWK